MNSRMVSTTTKWGSGIGTGCHGVPGHTHDHRFNVDHRTGAAGNADLVDQRLGNGCRLGIMGLPTAAGELIKHPWHEARVGAAKGIAVPGEFRLHRGLIRLMMSFSVVNDAAPWLQLN